MHKLHEPKLNKSKLNDCHDFYVYNSLCDWFKKIFSKHDIKKKQKLETDFTHLYFWIHLLTAISISN